jgi:hypothetical protein
MQKLKKSGKRFLCLAMAAVMLVGSTTGCGKKAKKDNVTVAETVAESTENIMERPTENVTKPAEEKSTENVTEPSEEKPTEEKPTEQETATEEETEADSYTITIGNAADDAKLTKLTKKRGVKLSSINGPYIDGKIFLGWYYDSALNDEVAVDDILDKDMTLYADYGDAMPINEGGSSNYVCSVDEKTDFTIYVTTDTVERKKVSTDDVKAALKLTNITSPERTDGSSTLIKDVLVVAEAGTGKYSVTAKEGFEKGSTYKLEIFDYTHTSYTSVFAFHGIIGRHIPENRI